LLHATETFKVNPASNLQTNISIMQKRIPLIFFFIALIPVLLQAQSTDRANTASKLDSILITRYAANEPGAAVLVMEKDKVLLRKGYGLANMESKEPLKPDMVFRIGSITKQFTSTAILKLAEEGKINLANEITNYLPDFKIQSKVTVEQLLNHTSGIKSYTSLADIMSAEGKKKNMAVSEMLEIIEKQPVDFSPGDQWLYNNSGYFLLGAIIENVTGTTYREFITKTFFKPSGMKSSYVDDSQSLPKAATGYVRVSDQEYKVADYVHPSIPFAAGSIYSTVDDLWKWNQAVFNFKLVDKLSLYKAWEPTKLNDGQLQSYGYGWQLGKVGKSKAIGHGGGIDGFVSFEVYVPEKQIYVAILSNNMTSTPEDLAYLLMETVVGNLTKPTPIAIDEKSLDRYTGVYKINEREERIISRHDLQLYSQRTGGNKLKIYPYAEGKFAFSESASEIIFHRDATGNISSMELSGREWVNQLADKTNKPIPSERSVYPLNPEDFDDFVGEYELAPGFILNVWREGSVYKTQATGQPPFEIYPESATKFFLKVVDAQLNFNRGDDGKISSLTLFQGGREIPGKKIK